MKKSLRWTSYIAWGPRERADPPPPRARSAHFPRNRLPSFPVCHRPVGNGPRPSGRRTDSPAAGEVGVRDAVLRPAALGRTAALSVLTVCCISFCIYTIVSVYTHLSVYTQTPHLYIPVYSRAADQPANRPIVPIPMQLSCQLIRPNPRRLFPRARTRGSSLFFSENPR